jgi:hypothetical protein
MRRLTAHTLAVISLGPSAEPAGFTPPLRPVHRQNEGGRREHGGSPPRPASSLDRRRRPSRRRGRAPPRRRASAGRRRRSGFVGARALLPRRPARRPRHVLGTLSAPPRVRPKEARTLPPLASLGRAIRAADSIPGRAASVRDRSPPRVSPRRLELASTAVRNVRDRSLRQLRARIRTIRRPEPATKDAAASNNVGPLVPGVRRGRLEVGAFSRPVAAEQALGIDPGSKLVSGIGRSPAGRIPNAGPPAPPRARPRPGTESSPSRSSR